jgi:hypothetical protein
MTMLSNYESKLMSRLVDLNWEIHNGNHPDLIRQALVQYYNNTEAELEDSMGLAEYREFMRKGREMFAPL